MSNQENSLDEINTLQIGDDVQGILNLQSSIYAVINAHPDLDPLENVKVNTTNNKKCNTNNVNVKFNKNTVKAKKFVKNAKQNGMQNGHPPLENVNDTNDRVQGNTCKLKNAKRTRRKIRKRHEKHKTPVFLIKAVKCRTKHVYIRSRNPDKKSINLHSFHSSSAPYVCITKFPSENMANLNYQEKRRTEENVHRQGPSRRRDGAQNRHQNHHNLVNQKLNHASNNKNNKVDLDKFKPYLNFNDVVYGLESGKLLEGKIRINPKNFKEAYVSNPDRKLQDFLINGIIDRNKALEGDVVVIELKPRKFWNDEQKTAQVVYIKEKLHSRRAVGTLLPCTEKTKKFAKFVARDHRIPRIRILSSGLPENFYAEAENYKDILFLVEITDWKSPAYAFGKIIKTIGKMSDVKVESEALLLENDLDVSPFPSEAYDFLPKSSGITSDEIEARLDLRKECIFTIDPATAKDLDDAVSCKELPNGNLEIGVHIADVSFYLKEANSLDIAVAKRATSIYLVDKVYHMLPVELCNLCSLLPGKDCLAFSVIWEMTREGNIIAQKFTRTVINSCAQLSYEHAQAMIDNPIDFDKENLPTIHNEFTPEQLCDIVNKLQKIAVNYRNKRFENGALRIDQVKLNFQLDPLTGDPIDFNAHESKAAHRLIEEFMLLANMSVAQNLLKVFPDLAFLRSHDPPNPRMLTEIKNNLEHLEMSFDINSSAEIHKSLEKYAKDTSFLGECRMQVLNHLLSKPMNRAEYICSGLKKSYHHYALNADVYTHFTSPIRRYADVMVHRLLAAALGYQDHPIWGTEFLDYIVQNCNRQKYNAKKAGEGSSDMYLARYIDKNQPFIEPAVIVDVKDKSCDVLVVKTGSIIRLYMNNLEEEEATCTVEQIKGTRQHRILVTFLKTESQPEVQVLLEMFQVIKIEITRKENTYKLKGKLLRPDR